ncbi:cysteine-rich receptor-like protein kinase 8 [Tanacetum coccineum]
MAKFVKFPYSVSESHSETPFHLIHIDIWGPYKVPTIGQHKYFFTIVDDYSRAVWTYLLVKKSQAFTIFKSFITFVKTQFGKDIKVLRPQQNGRVERRHRNILEIARALRLHAHLPVNYWGDCVITATYLINRFPTSVLKFKTPYEVLLKSKPMYDHLRVFGCLAVASNPSRVTDKFEARGVPSFIPPESTSEVSTQVSNQEVLTDNSVSEPEFEPVLVPNTTLQPEATRRSSRVPVQLSWLKDYVTPHQPKANQVSVTPLQTQFQAFLCALAIACHWIYKTKLKADGSLERKKARLVIIGNRQRKGVDYGETFAPVAKMVTVKALLVVAAMKGWDLCQMDVSNAFLHGDLFEEVYMQMPQGYVGQGENVQDKTSSTLVCKLKKSLYGLKQAPRQWFAKLSSALLSFGFVQSKADYSLFTKSDKSSFTAILVYVDDLLIIGSSPSEIQSLKSQLSSHFHMKDLGELSYFLGLEICKEVYRRFIGKLILLSPGLIFATLCSLFRYLLNSPGQGPSNREYRAMALTCCEVTWLVSLLKDFGLKDLGPVDLKDQIKRGEVLPSYVSTKSQLADVFTKVLPADQHAHLMSKLGVAHSSHSPLGECKREVG